MKSASLIAIIPLCLSLPGHAAALERSGQNIQSFFETGNYTEFSLGQIQGNVSGENANREQLSESLGITDFSTGNLVEDSVFIQAALKLQLHPKFSAGLIFDQPFGIKVNYDYRPKSILGYEQLEAVDIHLKTQNITALAGFQPNSRWNIYAGLAQQSFEGDLSLFGQSYYFFNGYQVQLKKDYAPGWLAGLSYQIPEMALRTSLTYRSKIKHKVQALENTPDNGDFENFTKIETPQSVTFDFMSPVSASNLIFGTIRWVNWKDFKIQPDGFSQVIDPYVSFVPALAEFNLVDYKADQWSAKLGIAHQVNAQWYASLETAWDSGSRNPSSTVNPADGYNSIGPGFRHNFSSKTYLSGGIYYFRFRPSKPDKNSITVTSLSTLENKEAWVYGLKIGHSF
ncbi:OmpP1/FadL family transporter [Acinetobacter pragensis]|uniref:OmpP1/FadL family transporter n=1 Tax=Acinetobacter pragensis TaxID=1806892 RepID=UPI0033408012